MTLDIKLMIESLPFVLTGLPYTIGLAFASFLTGNLVSIVLIFVGYARNPLIRSAVRLYVSFFRGIPALVLLFLLYFGLPVRLSALSAVLICFTLTSAAFLTEIYRGAIQGIDKGQWEAARSLGFTQPAVLRLIILPQAFRLAVPGLGNVAIDLLKGTSLAAMITIPDIFQKAKIIGGREFNYMSLYVLIAVIYWLLCIGIERLVKRIEISINRY